MQDQMTFSIMPFVMENCIILKHVEPVEAQIDSEMDAQQYKDITTTTTNPLKSAGSVNHATMIGTNTTNQSLTMESRNPPRISILSSAGSRDHVRILALQEMEKAWQESEAGCFMRSLGCAATLSQDSSFWKMYLPLLADVEQRWSEKLPRWGMIVDGALYPLQALEQGTKEIDGSYWLTPTTMDYLSVREGEALENALYRGKDRKSKRKVSGRLNEQVAYPQMWPTPDASARGASKSRGNHHYTLQDAVGSGKLNPKWVEWLMGYPKGWTELKPLETQSCPSKLEKLLKF